MSGLLRVSQPATGTQQACIREVILKPEANCPQTFPRKISRRKSLCRVKSRIAASVLQSEPLTPKFQSTVLTAADVTQTERTKVLELYEEELTTAHTRERRTRGSRNHRFRTRRRIVRNLANGKSGGRLGSITAARNRL